MSQFSERKVVLPYFMTSCFSGLSHTHPPYTRNKSTPIQSHPLTPSLFLTHCLSALSPFHSLALSRSPSDSFSLSLALSLFLALSCPLTLCLFHSLPPPVSPHSLPHPSLSPSPSLTRSHSVSPSLSLSPFHSLSLSHSLFLFVHLSLSLALSRLVFLPPLYENVYHPCSYLSNCSR